jgi:crossover junction endodeoxyribonuclease RuvC
MIILGIDPGIATTGWGVIETDGFRVRPVAFGSLETPKTDTTSQRLAQIYGDMNEILETYRPEWMAIEELFFNTNQTTGIRVAEARGVMLLCAEQHGVKMAEYTPLQVKQSVVGYGRAEKKQVIEMVTQLLGLPRPPKPDDTADALAIAICHAHTGTSRIAAYYNQ